MEDDVLRFPTWREIEAESDDVKTAWFRAYVELFDKMDNALLRRTKEKEG
jgi:hypothetical protein